MLDQIRSQLSAYQPTQNPNQNVNRASVLVPILERSGELRLLLTKRSENLRYHSGEVSFPGGKQDDQDSSALETALRETHEEIGLLPHEASILGCLDQIISLHYYLVTPYVGLIPPTFLPQINTQETEAVFEVPLDLFIDPNHHWSEVLNHRNLPVISHHFIYNEFDIWGLTAKLILRLLEVGLGYIPDFPIHHPDAPSWIDMAQHFDGTENSLVNQTHSPS